MRIGFPRVSNIIPRVIAAMALSVLMVQAVAAAAPTFAWNTFYGAGTYNYCYGTAVDTSGNVYVTGWSSAAWNGPNNESPLNAYSNVNNIFILKLSKEGTYLWHTFYGAGSSGKSIAVDGNGNVYVTGYSQSVWNGPAGQPPLHASGNIHIVKLATNGAYQWHTFYGTIEGHGIAVDSGGNVYISGSAYSNWSGPDGQPPLNAHAGGTQAIVALKLNSSGSYQWHTFYGAGSQATVGNGIVLDGSGNLYIAGYGDLSWNGPDGQIPLSPASGNSQDIVVMKLSSSGIYQWHTFYGPINGSTAGYGIASDGTGNIYLTGYANGGWNGPADQAPLNAYAGYSDVFILKLANNGTYQWHTFFGPGNGGYGIAANSEHVYVAGYANTLWNGPAGQAPLSGNSGISILELNASGAYQWHAFYGSSVNSDTGYGIAVDSSGNIFVAGHGRATWGSPLHAFNGTSNIFVLNLRSAASQPQTDVSAEIICPASVTAGTPLNVGVKIHNKTCSVPLTFTKANAMLVGNAGGTLSGLGIYGPQRSTINVTAPAAVCPAEAVSDQITVPVVTAVNASLSGKVAQVMIEAMTPDGQVVASGECMVPVQ